MAINFTRNQPSLMWFLIGLGLYLAAWQRLEIFHELLKQKQINELRQAMEREKLLHRVIYSQEFLLKTWLHTAQLEECQVIKIHPSVRDPKIQHFRLLLQGNYLALLKWLKRVEHDLPDLKWERLSFVANRELKLELVVDCYASV